MTRIYTQHDNRVSHHRQDSPSRRRLWCCLEGSSTCRHRPADPTANKLAHLRVHARVVVCLVIVFHHVVQAMVNARIQRVFGFNGTDLQLESNVTSHGVSTVVELCTTSGEGQSDRRPAVSPSTLEVPAPSHYGLCFDTSSLHTHVYCASDPCSRNHLLTTCFHSDAKHRTTSGVVALETVRCASVETSKP